MKKRTSTLATFMAYLTLSSEAFTVPSRGVFLMQKRGALGNRITGLAMTEEGNDEQKEDHLRPSIEYRELEGIQMTEEELALEVKKYKLRTEIDSIMNDPEGAPFDLESELKKVTGGISPALAADAPEMAVEENVHDIESEMYSAVEAKDFERAQSKKEELSRMHIDDIGSVLQINSAFYKAFSSKDYMSMELLWLHDACALCIHPSNTPVIGAKNVLNSWKEMFDGGNEAFQKNKIEPSNIRLSVKGTTAILTCDEDIFTKRFVRGKKRVGYKDNKNGMELVNKLLTTNIFRKVSNKWYMVHHHASWHHDSEAAKNALNPKRSRGGKSNLSPKSNDEGASTMEGILGIPGHEGLGGESESGDQKPVRHIVRGSLSDLLGGGLSDLLGGDMGGDNLGMGDMEEGVESIIIRSEDLGGIGGKPRRASDDDDDDDDDNDNDDETKTRSIINVESEPSEKKPQPKDTIRQNCIQALRVLANEGSISPKQKRMLLTDIIIKSSTGDYSMVEVAYDLLCTEDGDDEEAGKEDFAEQCKVFATTLPEVPIQMSQ